MFKKRLPKSYANSYYNKRDIFNGLMFDLRTLYDELVCDKHNYCEEEIATLSMYIQRLSGIEYHVNMNFSHNKCPWIQKHLKTSTKNIIQTIDSTIKNKCKSEYELI